MYAIITSDDTEIASSELLTPTGDDFRLKAVVGRDGVATLLGRLVLTRPDIDPPQWDVHWRGSVEACLREFTDLVGDYTIERAGSG